VRKEQSVLKGVLICGLFCSLAAAILDTLTFADKDTRLGKLLFGKKVRGHAKQNKQLKQDTRQRREILSRVLILPRR
jgi:hypothetical protein